MKTIHSIYPGILLVLVCFLVSVNPSISQSAGVNREPPYNALEDAKGIEDWRNEQYEKLRKEGKATSEEFKKVDTEALNKGRNLEHKRQKALNEIFEKAGVKMPAQTGTTPGAPESRGVLGDVDFESLPPRERDKVLKAAEDLGYKTTPKGDALTIKELDSTVHREEYKRKSGPMQQSEQVGRAAGKETASSYGGTDPTTGKPITTDKHTNTMDNLKKGGHALSKNPGKMTNSDWAEMGKMTSRNMANGSVKNADLRNKAEMLKKGYSPEAAGIVPDNATPAQREKALREFHQQCKEANRQAYSNTEKISKNKENELKSKVNEQKAKLDEAIKKGNQSEIDSARKNLQDSREKLTSHNTKQQAARESVRINQGESVIKEMEKAPGTSKPGDVKEPVKGKPTISEPVGKVKVKDVNLLEKPVNLIKENLTIEKGGGLFIFGYEAYEGYKRRMEEDPKRSKLDAAGNATLEATGIPALHTIAIKTANEHKGEPEKAAIATAWNIAKAVTVGFVEYTIDKAKKITEFPNEFSEMRQEQMAKNRDVKRSEEEMKNQRKYIYDALIKEGASPVGASVAVEALEKGDGKPLHDLKANLKVKKEAKERAEKEAKKDIDVIDKGNKKVDDLKDSETRTDQMDKNMDENKEGQSMELAKNTNVTESYHKDKRHKHKQETEQVQKTSGITQSERESSSQEKDQREKSKIEAQGKLTDRTISSSQKEHAGAEQTAQAERQTGIGTIIAGGLFGGLSSGVAVGLDGFFGGLGKGAGEQASVKMGIQPKPSPPPSTPSSESESQPSSSAGSEPQSSSIATSSPSSDSGTKASPTAESEKGKLNPPTSSKPSSSQGSKPSNTGTKISSTTGSGQSKPASSQGTKPDCTEYRRRAEDLTSSYERGAISTAAYQGEMRDLRAKYQSCNESTRAPKTPGTPTTSTQGATTEKKPEKIKDDPNHPLNKWHCDGWTGGCCTNGWHCQGNACGPLDPKISADTKACMRKLGIIR